MNKLVPYPSNLVQILLWFTNINGFIQAKASTFQGWRWLGAGGGVIKVEMGHSLKTHQVHVFVNPMIILVHVLPFFIFFSTISLNNFRVGISY